MKKNLLILIVIFGYFFLYSDTGSLQIARLKYDGGGDWYNDPDVIPNITKFFNSNVSSIFKTDEAVVTLRDTTLIDYPILYMTGHGNVVFSDFELQILRNYLLSGGFIYIDDDYGMDNSIRQLLSKLFSDRPLVRIFSDYKIFTSFYNFDYLPKIHEHDDKQPEMWGIFIGERLALVYTYESNISDGWAGENVHGNPPEVREEALKFGVNILYYALTQ
ncbi:MAG: DUF4159 domain-containing protein [Candidatus Muiribacteriota bacterium]